MLERLQSKMAARQIDKKSESRLRWAVLVLGCLGLIANYYCYDNPSALMVPLAEATGMNSNDFALTYSVYSFPNMVLPFFGGFLCDRYGPGRVLILFALLLTAVRPSSLSAPPSLQSTSSSSAGWFMV